jgi:hypothetical protein
MRRWQILLVVGGEIPPLKTVPLAFRAAAVQLYSFTNKVSLAGVGGLEGEDRWYQLGK